MVSINKFSKYLIILLIGVCLIVLTSSCDNKKTQPKYEYGERLKHPVINFATITKDSVAMYEQLAAKGDQDAMFMLAHCYNRGIYCGQDSLKAMSLLRKAAVAGSYDAQMLICKLYSNDWDQRVWPGHPYALLDYKSHNNVNQTQQFADQGQAWAQVLVGYFYLYGYCDDNYKGSHKKAREWFEKASNQGFAWGQYEYARILHKNDTKFSDNDYYYYLSKAADQGCLNAFYSLLDQEDKIDKQKFGYYCNYFFPVFDTDTLEDWRFSPDSIEVYKSHVEKGESEAELRLGISYLNGKQVEKDSIKGWDLIYKSANKGNSRANFILGYYGVKNHHSFDLQLQHYYLSAMQGNTLALGNLGLCYAEHVNLNLAKYFFNEFYARDSTDMNLNRNIGMLMYRNEQAGYASFFLNRAVKLGCKDANVKYNLAQCLYNGWGGKKDYKLAMDYFMSVEQKMPRAKTYIGLCYENGQGVNADMETAINWYKKAESAKDALACYRLGLCYEYGRGVRQDMGKAVEYYINAGKGDVSDVYLRLAQCYAKGNGVEQDTVIANEWYSKAAENNNQYAKIHLYGVEDSGSDNEISSWDAVKSMFSAIFNTPRSWHIAKSNFKIWLKNTNIFVIVLLALLLCWGLIKLLKRLIKPQNSFVNKTRRVVFEDGNDETWYFSSNHCLLIIDNNGETIEHDYIREKNGQLRINNYHGKDIQLISFNYEENPKVKGNKLKDFQKLNFSGLKDYAYMFKFTEDNSPLKFGEIKRELELKQYIGDVWQRWLKRKNWIFRTYGERDFGEAIVTFVCLLIPILTNLFCLVKFQDKGALVGLLIFGLFLIIPAFQIYTSILGKKIEKRIRTRQNQGENEEINVVKQDK